jgi:hypothetical protein
MSNEKPAGPPVTGDGDEASLRGILGRLVRAQWMAWARKQPNPKASWLVEWESLSEPDREVDRLIGESLYEVGLTRGRALGAREERADIIRDAHESHCYCCPGQPRCPICEFADAIARCAGRGT